MVDVASLLVRLGADATGFMSTMSKVGSSTSQTFGTLRGISRGVVAEMNESLGIKLPAALQQAQRGFDFLGVAAQSFGKDMSWASSVSKASGAQLAAASEGAFRFGTAIGTIINDEILSKSESFQRVIGNVADKHRDWIDELAGSEERYQQQWMLYDRMREKLGLLDEEWAVSSERTQENAARLAILTDALGNFNKALGETKKYVDPVTRDMLKLGNAIRGYQSLLKTGEQSVDDFIEQLKEMHGIVADDDPLQALAKLQEEFRLLAASGEASSAQLVASFAPRVEELKDELDRLGISLPDAMDEWISALEGPGSGMAVMDQFIAKLKRELPDAAAIAKEALRQTGADFGGAIRDARGELTELGRELDAFVTKRELVLEIAPDWSRYDREVRERGLQSPGTGGTLP